MCSVKTHQRVVLAHPQMGVYLGHCFGLGFWTEIDTVDQTHAVTFTSEQDAREHVGDWESHDDPDDFEYVAVDCADLRPRASISELVRAGLGDRLGDMTDNLTAHATLQ